MWCAECGNKLTRREDGAWNGCCNRWGYWTKEGPLASDGWYPHHKEGEFHFYPGPRWPRGLKPVTPKKDE